MIKKIDHIGIVVSSMDRAVERYATLLFLQPSYTEYFEETRVELAFFDIGGVCIELLAPAAPEGDIWNFLQENGEGFHHVCYEVDDLSAALKMLKKKGVKLIDERPRSGSRGTIIAFVSPESSNGALTEYCQFQRERNL